MAVIHSVCSMANVCVWTKEGSRTRGFRLFLTATCREEGEGSVGLVPMAGLMEGSDILCTPRCPLAILLWGRSPGRPRSSIVLSQQVPPYMEEGEGKFQPVGLALGVVEIEKVKNPLTYPLNHVWQG